ncbi:MAG: hypothetical protein LLF97_03195 [Planctomycetaceae bacterium]|nr:hypothetical protein [Planctomycetaceae bacterium]
MADELLTSRSAAPPPAIAPSADLTPDREADVFAKMRHRLLRTLLWQTFSRSRFRVSLVASLCAILWGGMFWIFRDGFLFLQANIQESEIHTNVIGAAFGVFFATLLIMIVFSSGVILYSFLFCSKEAAFLLTIPARTQRVFLHKFQEAVVLSSWGFVLLGSPSLIAFGLTSLAPWYYYVMLLPNVFAFVYIPVAVGAIACLLIVRFFPNGRKAMLWGGAAVFIASLVWAVWQLLDGFTSNLLTPNWFVEMLDRLHFSEQRLLPSWWLSSSLLDAVNGAWAESVLFMTLLISNALLLRQVSQWIAKRTYRDAYSGLCGRTGRRRRRPGRLRFDNLLSAALDFLPPPAKLILIKDLRIFRRDPVQWSQLLIFLGLLAFYFLNIRRFTYNPYYVGWVNMVSFLNLAVVGLLLSTFTTRFVFPMISLEGRRFWILGLLPIPRETILWSKFLFAVGGSIIPCSLLVLLSDVMLDISPLVLASHQVTCLLLCLGLSGIAVGLGARLPNFCEQSPARIAAGFGGTLNLFISTLYILAIVLLTALPVHFYLAAEMTSVWSNNVIPSTVEWWVKLWLIVGTISSILLGVLATVVPLRIGLRAFRQMEF